MAFIVQTNDFNTHIYEEYINEISRDQTAILQKAIDRAISQAKGYCSRFDLAKLFGTAQANATVADEQLKGIVKDIALWHFLQLSNTNIELSRAQAAYEYAIQWLKDVQSGKVVPDGWVYRDTSSDTTPPEGNDIAWQSNTKRTNHW